MSTHFERKVVAGETGLDSGVGHVLEHIESFARASGARQRLEYRLVGEHVGLQPIGLHALHLAKHFGQLAALGRSLEPGVEVGERPSGVEC